MRARARCHRPFRGPLLVPLVDPGRAGASAFADYREAAAPGLPAVADEAFEQQVRAATVGWALTSTTWFLDTALGDDPPLTRTPRPDPPGHDPAAAVARRGERTVPALAELAGELGAALENRWGGVPLEPARAFAAG